MNIFAHRPITLVEARVLAPDGRLVPTVRIAAGRIAGVGCRPDSGDTILDLGGDLVLPGLINAHDHLELNNFPRLKWRERYRNVREWIADFQPRFETDPDLTAPLSIPLADRLFLGGIKNLLCGATTVCHHNPLYRPLHGDFPVRIVRDFGFSHSIQVDGEKVRSQYERTPVDRPWIIHAAEGMDETAAEEFQQLMRRGCIGPNTLLVHGIGLRDTDVSTLIAKGGGLIWCPSSNDFLFGTTLDVSVLAGLRRVALGTDSRLSGGWDLLDEIKHASAQGGLSAESLVNMVTVDAAALLRLEDAGRLRPGVPADLVVIPVSADNPLDSLPATDRSKLRMVMLGGRVLLGDLDLLMSISAGRTRWESIRLDHCEKLMARTLAMRLRRCRVQEKGCEL